MYISASCKCAPGNVWIGKCAPDNICIGKFAPENVCLVKYDKNVTILLSHSVKPPEESIGGHCVMSFFYLKKVYIKKVFFKTAYLRKVCLKKSYKEAGFLRTVCLKSIRLKSISLKSISPGAVCLKTARPHTDGKKTGRADTVSFIVKRGKSRVSGFPERFLLVLPALLIALSLLCGCGAGSAQPVLEAVPGAYAEEGSDPEKTDSSGRDPEKTDAPGSDSEKTDPSGTDSEKTDSSGTDPEKTDSAEPDSEKTNSADQNRNSGNNEEKALTGDDSRGTLTVHVCGAVKKEGVYTLPQGSRIRDAIEAAGGFDKDADTSFLNLAMKLEDSWQIRVPTVREAEELRQERGGGKTEEAVLSTTDTDSPGITRGPVSGEDTDKTGAKSGSSSDEDQKININTASVEELMAIPGIGQSKAQKIIEYREKNGRFETIEDIMKVSGIKENSFRKMRDRITV